MSADLGRAIEDASLRAWPGIETHALDGWELRFSQGFTRRANSVQPLGPSTLPFTEKVARCEAWYAARGVPCTFRLTRFANPDLDPFLGRRGYEAIDQVAVMRRMIPPIPSNSTGLELEELAMPDWIAAYGALIELPEGPPAAMRGIFTACRQEQLFGVIRSSLPGGPGGPACCGVAVRDEALIGLFDLVTAAPLRRKGYCSSLIAGLLAWGVSGGAAHAYLQVVRLNHAAMTLYEKLGFETAYDYWYRVRAS